MAKNNDASHRIVNSALDLSQPNTWLRNLWPLWWPVCSHACAHSLPIPLSNIWLQTGRPCQGICNPPSPPGLDILCHAITTRVPRISPTPATPTVLSDHYYLANLCYPLGWHQSANSLAKPGTRRIIAESHMSCLIHAVVWARIFTPALSVIAKKN